MAGPDGIWPRVEEMIESLPKVATREAYGKALVELGRENPDIVVLGGDLNKSTFRASIRPGVSGQILRLWAGGAEHHGSCGGDGRFRKGTPSSARFPCLGCADPSIRYG